MATSLHESDCNFLTGTIVLMPGNGNASPDDSQSRLITDNPVRNRLGHSPSALKMLRRPPMQKLLEYEGYDPLGV